MKIVNATRDSSFWMEHVGDEVVVGGASPDEVLLRLKANDAAKRAYELVRRNDALELYLVEYNCHAAAEFVMRGRNAENIRHVDADPDIPVTQMTVRQAVDSLEMPCGFQLHSMCLDDDGDNASYVAHSGVLLGITEAGEALGLEKDGPGLLRICTLETIRQDQRRTTMDKAYFYGTPRTPEPATPSVS